MARYDFLDEETRKKLKERQEKIISKKKQEEVKESKERKDKGDEEESKGPQVYTKEDGQIGGVIYPKGESSKRSKSPSEQIMGDDEEKSTNNPGKSPEDDLPIQLHHTEKTKVGTEDRPAPAKKKDPKKIKEENIEKGKKNTKEAEDALDEIWK